MEPAQGPGKRRLESDTNPLKRQHINPVQELRDLGWNGNDNEGMVFLLIVNRFINEWIPQEYIWQQISTDRLDDGSRVIANIKLVRSLHPNLTQALIKRVVDHFGVQFETNVSLWECTLFVFGKMAELAQNQQFILHQIANSNVLILQSLARYGADFTFLRQVCPNLIHDSVLSGRVDSVATSVLVLGMDVNACNDKGDTPLHVALKNNQNLAITSLLLKLGARSDIADRQGITVKEIEEFASLKEFNDRTKPPVSTPAIYQQYIKYKGLLETFVDRKIFPTELIVYKGKSINVTETLKLLRSNIGLALDYMLNKLPKILELFYGLRKSAENLEHVLGMRPYPLSKFLIHLHDEIILNMPSEIPALHRLFNYNLNINENEKIANLRMARWLIANGADVNEVNEDNSPPLHCLYTYNGLYAVQFLVAHGADVHLKDNDGNTLLHLILQNDEQDNETIDFLIEKTTDFTIADNQGNTVLHLLCHDVDMDRNVLIKRLEKVLYKGADVAAQNRYGTTPLHYSIKPENLAVVQLLLDFGANASIKNRRGRTPLDLANANPDMAAIAQLLKNHITLRRIP